MTTPLVGPLGDHIELHLLPPHTEAFLLVIRSGNGGPVLAIVPVPIRDATNLGAYIASVVHREYDSDAPPDVVDFGVSDRGALN